MKCVAVFVGACALLWGVISTSAADNLPVDDTILAFADDEEFGAGRPKEAEKPERGKARKGKKEEAKEEEPAEEPEKEDPKADAKKDEAAEEKKDGEEFGGARGEKKSHKLDESDLETNKDKAKYVKTLRKQFRKDDGFYVLLTMEKGIEKDIAATANEKNAKPVMKPYERLEWEILEGREEAVGFVVGFMSEFGEPWAKKAKGGRKKGAAELEAPKPLRNWKIEGHFESAEEAEGFREQKQNAYAAAVQAKEELNKPRTNR